MFFEDGFRRPIRVFPLHVYIGNHLPICCKPPRYIPHEYEFMLKIVESMDENCVVEEDDGTWGAFLVLAAKPHQLNFPWRKYQWRLCVSYQNLNQVTRPFTFLTPLCDDVLQDIDT